MMFRDLDEIDYRIIDALKKNARISLQGLSQAAGLSRNATRNRLRRLERSGVISGYTVVLGKPEEQPISAIIFVYRKDRLRGGGVIQKLLQWRETRECAVLTGDKDIMAMLEVDTQGRLQEIWTELSALEEIDDTDTHIVLKRFS